MTHVQRLSQHAFPFLFFAFPFFFCFLSSLSFFLSFVLVSHVHLYLPHVTSTIPPNKHVHAHTQGARTNDKDRTLVGIRPRRRLPAHLWGCKEEAVLFRHSHARDCDKHLDFRQAKWRRRCAHVLVPFYELSPWRALCLWRRLSGTRPDPRHVLQHAAHLFFCAEELVQTVHRRHNAVCTVRPLGYPRGG